MPGPISRIRGARRREDTIVRLGGDGAWHCLTWTDDDYQLLSLCDAGDWRGVGASQDYFSSRLFQVSGAPKKARFEEVSSYPKIPLWDFIRGAAPAYYAMSTLAIGRVVIQFLSTFNRPFELDYFAFNAAKLIFSTDNGRTWRDRDGTALPEMQLARTVSRQSMTFFAEPQDAFSTPSFLQMGRAYTANTDGYVYAYAPNGGVAMHELNLFRVKKDYVLERSYYQFFVGLRGEGGAEWSPRIEERGVVLHFPEGWVMSASFPYSWHPSVVYNSALDLYLMANWGSGTLDDTKDIYPKPSYLGFWIAQNPWGPWRQIYEEPAWAPAGELSARAHRPTISPRWISADGKSFWITWTDLQRTRLKPQANTSDVLGAKTERRFRTLRAQWREAHQNFGLSTQRVDLILAA